MNIFFISDEIPYPGFSGSSVISWIWINYFLKKKHNIFLYIYQSRSNLPFDENIKKHLNNLHLKENIEVFYHKKIKIKKNLLSKFSMHNFLNISKDNYFERDIEKKLLNLNRT